MSSLTLENNYLDILKNEFTRRSRRNSSYSLRAFARDINIAPSSLSEIFNGEHGMSRQSASKIGHALKLSKEENEFFCDLVDSQHARSESKRAIAKARLIKFRNDPATVVLNKDSFDYIADWYHLAILALMACESFKSSYSWIAKALNIPEEQATDAIMRLIRLGMVKKNRHKFELVQRRTNTPPHTSRDAMLAFHHELVQKSSEAVFGQDASERELSATLIAIPTSRLDEAREMIRNFRSEFCQEFRKSIHRDEVYSLNMQFIRISDTAHNKKITKKKVDPCKQELLH